MVTAHQTLEGQHIAIGISGGIACYKIATLVSALVQKGALVDVLMTEAACKFISPLTFSSLTGKPVLDSQWTHIDGYEPQHIKIANRASLLMVAPCTMNMLAKLSNGMTDDPISLVASAIDRERTPVILAPSMNKTMYEQPATMRNIAVLKQDNFNVVDAESGWQACRAVGAGRMPEPDTLLEIALESLTPRLLHADQ